MVEYVEREILPQKPKPLSQRIYTIFFHGYLGGFILGLSIYLFSIDRTILAIICIVLSIIGIPVRRSAIRRYLFKR